MQWILFDLHVQKVTPTNHVSVKVSVAMTQLVSWLSMSTSSTNNQAFINMVYSLLLIFYLIFFIQPCL